MTAGLIFPNEFSQNYHTLWMSTWLSVMMEFAMCHSEPPLTVT